MAGTQEPAEEGDPSAGSYAVWRCLAPPLTLAAVLNLRCLKNDHSPRARFLFG
jgi:hypothetical protein